MPASYKKDVLIVFFLLAFVYAFFYQDGKANGNSRFGLIFASVQERTLSIDDYYDQPGTGTIDRAYVNGHYYSDKAIGPAVVGAVLYIPLYWMQQVFHHPGVAAVKEMITFLVIGLPSAAAGALLFLLCLYLSGSRFKSYLTTLAITMGTMYLPFSVIFFSHQFTAALLFTGFVLLFFMKEKPGNFKIGYLFLIGLLLGWALISEYPAAIIVFVLAIYYILILRDNREYRRWQYLVLPVLGGILPILLQLAYNKICYGNYFTIGYSYMDDSYFEAAMSKGIAGISWPNLSALYYMTIHPLMGLFWQSPVLLLGFIGFGFGLAQRKYRREIILAAIIIAVYLVILSGYYMWWGGSSLGPRHIIPMLPFFSLLLIFIPGRINWLFISLALVSIGQMIIAAASNVVVPDTMVLKIQTLGFFEYSNIYNYCWKELLDGNFAQNLSHRFLHLNSWVSLIPFFIVIAGITITFFRKEIWANRLSSALSFK